MRAMLMTERGGPEVLQWGELPDPTPGPGEILVRIRAVALNHLDIWVRKGVASPNLPLPHILGSDIVGEVALLGPYAENTHPGMQGGTGSTLAIGDRVAINPGLSCGRCQRCLSGKDNLCPSYKIIGEHIRGGYAELISVPRANVVAIPATLSYKEAVTVPLAGLTAWQMIERAGVEPGETVLVLAAGSGVSSWAIQIAKLRGAIVIAGASSDEKLERAKALGADLVVNTSHDYVKAVRALTGGRGAEVALDHTGAANWNQTIRSLAWGGRLVTCGATSGNEATTPLAHVFYRQLSILGSTMASKSALFELFKHVARGTLRPIIDRVLPIENARNAHEIMESRAFFGKLVLEV